MKVQVMTKRLKRVGIYDGTFNPIHYGHLACADWIRQSCNLDKILLVPSANPPNKTDVLDAEIRYEMVVAATRNTPYLEASRIDLDRSGSGIASLTMAEARRRLGDDVELFFLSGSEYLDPSHQWYLPDWEGADDLFRLCRLLFFPRNVTMEQLGKWAALVPQARIDIQYVPTIDISSTAIRDAVALKRSIAFMTPPAVQKIIAKRKLYSKLGVAA
jgi:nicotinate-nucleotide adenylyltransferase